MRHATRVLRVHEGGTTIFTALCSCGFVSADQSYEAAARNEANKHELAAVRQGVKVTHLEPAAIPGGGVTKHK